MVKKSYSSYDDPSASETEATQLPADVEPAPEERSPKAIDPLQVAIDKLVHATTLDVHDRLAAMQAVLLALAAVVKEKSDGNE